MWLVRDIGTSKIFKFKFSNLLLWFFCLKSRVNCSRITQPFLNPNLIFFSNAPQIVCCRIIKKNQNKDLENLNILEVPMSWTSYQSLFCPPVFVQRGFCSNVWLILDLQRCDLVSYMHPLIPLFPILSDFALLPVC